MSGGLPFDLAGRNRFRTHAAPGVREEISRRRWLLEMTVVLQMSSRPKGEISNDYRFVNRIQSNLARVGIPPTSQKSAGCCRARISVYGA